MNFLSESKKEKTPSPKMNSLEKKIDKLIIEGHCSDASAGSLATTPKIGNQPYLEKIEEQVEKWNKSNVSKPDQKIYLKNALICRVKHQNEKIREIVRKMQGLKASTPSMPLEHELKRNVEHKLFVIEYITKHKLLETTSSSPSRSKSVFRTIRSVFSSKKAGGKTKKGRKTRRKTKTYKKK